MQSAALHYMAQWHMPMVTHRSSHSHRRAETVLQSRLRAGWTKKRGLYLGSLAAQASFHTRGAVGIRRRARESMIFLHSIRQVQCTQMHVQRCSAAPAARGQVRSSDVRKQELEGAKSRFVEGPSDSVS